jgi:hypothetical protein
MNASEMLKLYEEFCQATIKKPEPTTEKDAQVLLLELTK